MISAIGRGMQWLWDIADHSEICLEGTVDGEAEILAARLDGPSSDTWSERPTAPGHAIILRCDAFLTVERRLPRNAAHIEQRSASAS